MKNLNLLIKNIEQFLNNIIGETKKSEKKFLDESKKDEAVFEKIKGNVADIYFKMINVSLKKSKGNYDKFVEAYIDYLNKISTPWKENLEKAEAHNAFEEAAIEKIKLDVWENIKSKFFEMTKEA